jgi:hypothetical protein
MTVRAMPDGWSTKQTVAIAAAGVFAVSHRMRR